MTLISILPDFVFGVCSAADRKANWTLFKKLCDEQKLHGGTIDFGNSTVQLYHKDQEKIRIEEGQELNIKGTTYDLIFYPFVPRDGFNYVFDMAYGAQLSITGGNIRLAERQNLFESYQCEFKDNGLIKVIGPVRKDFWDTLKNGQKIYCSWSNRILGKTSTVATWDKTLGTIFMVGGLGAISPVPNESWVGFDFVDGVSEKDYATFGRHWVMYPKEFTFINVLDPWAVTGPDTVINLTNTKIENWKNALMISSGSFKVNLKGVVEINNSEIAISAFARSQLNHQSILGPKATLVMRNNGMNSVGSISNISASNIYGSGAYIHPTVIVQIDKFRGYNNHASTFRQYSSSIKVICPPDYQSWIHDFQCEGSGEEDLKTSNCMPVTVDYLKALLNLLIGGNLTVKGGIIGSVNLPSTLHPPKNTETKIQINNCTFTSVFRSGWGAGVSEFTDLEFNKCKFMAGVAFTNNWTDPKAHEAMVFHDGYSDGKSTFVRSITINDCEYLSQPIPAGLSASSFIRTALFMKVNINRMRTDSMKGGFLLGNSLQTQPPSDKVVIHIDHSEINMGLMLGSQYFLPGQIQGTETTVSPLGLSGNWSKP